MNELKNRAFALLNAWTTGEVSALESLVAPQFEEVDRPDATAVGLEGLGRKLARFHQAHSHVRLMVRQQLVDGDKVCTQWVMVATLRTPGDTQSTQQEMMFMHGISWTYFANGKIARNCIYRDALSQLFQRGFQWAHAGARKPSHAGIPDTGAQEAATTIHTGASPRELLKQLVTAASIGTTYMDFMQTHLAEGLQGTVAPNYTLNKSQTIRRFAEVFAMAAGGTVTIGSAIEEGGAACARVVLLQKKHNLKYTQNLNPLAEVVVDVSLWLEINEAGQIVQLHLVGDMLTPGMARGMKMVRAPGPAVEAATV